MSFFTALLFIFHSKYNQLYSLSLAREHSLEELREFSEIEREAYQFEVESLRQENLRLQEKDAEIERLMKQLVRCIAAFTLL